jgi:SNF2 family DNA or RNA helicase
MLLKNYNLEAKHDALSYQREALESIRNLEYCAIFHEQGLGKTKISIDLFLSWLTEKSVDRVLVVTKKGLLNNWKKEVSIHTHINPVALSENSFKSYRSVRSNAILFLTHYELFKTDLELIQLLTKNKNVAIILDEAHKIKNPKSALTKAFFEAINLFKRRVILTGTPIANRPYDIWSQIYFLDTGKSLGENFNVFKSKFDFPTINDPESMNESEYQKKDVFEHNLKNLYGKIDDFCIRETKKSSGLKLPRKEYIVLNPEWETTQYGMYQQVKEEMRLSIEKDGLLVDDISEDLLKRLLRLVQIASNPSILDESYHNTPGKAKIVDNLVNEIRNKGEKVIIWSSFTSNVDWLTKRYRNYNAVKIHGKMSMHNRNNSVDKFIQDKDVGVLIATPAAAKEGLTLTVANHVVFYDRSFSLDDYLQSQDRIHRISQVKTCYIYNIIMANSIDEWVDSLIQAKSAAARLAQGDITHSEYVDLAKYDNKKMLGEILSNHKEN